MKNALYYILCFLVFTMCKDRTEELLPVLSHAKSLMQHKPDSALILLNSIKISELSTDFQYASWCLLITQARDKNYMKHESDSLINNALNYFKKRDDPKKKAAAFYYKARVEYDLKNMEEATTYYLQARDIAQSTTDYTLLYLINSQLGALYLFRDLKDQASDAYLKAYDNAVRLNDSTYLSYSISCLGRIFSVDSCWTKSVECYNEAACIAEKSGNIKTLGDVLSELSAVYNRMGQLDSSLYYGQKALLLISDSLNVGASSLYFGLGHTYKLLGAYEQANTFLKKAIQNGNIYTVASAYQVLSEMNRKLENYEDALTYNELYLNYSDSIKKVDQGEKIAEIQRKYDHEKLVNANNQLTVEKSHIKNMALLILILLLVVISVMIIVYQRKLLFKERNIQQTKEQLRSHMLRIHENETIIRKNGELIKTLSSQLKDNINVQEHVNDQKQEIETISQKNELLQTQNESLREEIKSYSRFLQEKGSEINQYEQLSEQNSRLQEREMYLCDLLVNQIGTIRSLSQSPKFLSEHRWTELIKFVNQIYPEFTDRLQRNFPTLTVDELRFCCLLKLHFSNSAITVLIAISASSVTKRKQRLKEHLNQYLEKPLAKEISVESFILGY